MKGRLRLFIILLISVALVSGILAACNDTGKDADKNAGDTNGTVDTDGSVAEGQYSAVPYVIEGDTLSFGSYPQSEVTDETLTAALTQNLKDTAGWDSYYIEGTTIYLPDNIENVTVSVWKELSDGVWYADTVYNGAKYRAVYTAGETTDEVQPTAGGQLTWFRYEPIQWNIIASETDSGIETVTLLSAKALDYGCYDADDADDSISADFALSDLRNWLNGAFIDTAFDAFEKAVIVSDYAVNDGSTSGIGGTNEPTYDKVYLAARTEVVSQQSGVLRKGVSGYAKQMGATEDNVTWWLRSVHSEFEYALYVDDNGDIYSGSADEQRGIAPVIKIHLAYEGQHNHSLCSVLSSDTCTAPVYDEFYVCPVCYSCFKKSADGSFVYTEMEDHIVASAGHDIKENYVPSTYAHKGYFEYTCEDCGLYYRRNYQEVLDSDEPTRVNADGFADAEGEYLFYGKFPQSKVTDGDLIAELNNCVSADEFDGYPIYVYDGETYSMIAEESEFSWFRWDPVLWYIDSETDDGYSLVSAKILNARDFGGSNVYNGSEIYTWLNGEFSEAVFGETGQGVDLLSKDDIPEEGLAKTATDYARAKGLKNGCWWLQEAYTDRDDDFVDKIFVWCVNSDGLTTDRNNDNYDCVKEYSDSSVGVVVKIELAK